jgi:NitT/TauT family transport system substrate-binding protein
MHRFIRKQGRVWPIATAGTLALLTAVGTGVANANSARSRPEKISTTSVSVGVLPIADVAPVYLGIKEGYFAKQHLKVVPHALQGGADVAAAVIGGSLQFGFGATANLVEARSKGLPIQFIANGDDAAANAANSWSGILVGKGSSITSVKQLAGKTVAANALDGENELALDAVLEQNGVSPSSVHVVALPFPTMPSALAAGQVQAVTEVEPFVSAIQAQGGTKISPLFEGIADSTVVAGYFANTHEIAKQPGLVARFVAAMDQSLAFARTHPGAVRAIIPTYTAIPSAVAAKMHLPVWSSSINTANIQTQERLMMKLHWISKSVAVDKLIWSGAKT